MRLPAKPKFIHFEHVETPEGNRAIITKASFNAPNNEWAYSVSYFELNTRDKGAWWDDNEGLISITKSLCSDYNEDKLLEYTVREWKSYYRWDKGYTPITIKQLKEHWRE